MLRIVALAAGTTVVVLFGLLTFIARLSLEKDYDYWAPKLAAALIRLASWWLRMSHLAWKFGSGPDDFYAATSFF
jgi:hypothetical protein